MNLRILSAFWRSSTAEEPKKSTPHVSHRQDTDETDGRPDLRKSELRLLFRNTFDEMQRDMPVGAGQTARHSSSKKASQELDAAN